MNKIFYYIIIFFVSSIVSNAVEILNIKTCNVEKNKLLVNFENDQFYIEGIQKNEQNNYPFFHLYKMDEHEKYVFIVNYRKWNSFYTINKENGIFVVKNKNDFIENIIDKIIDSITIIYNEKDLQRKRMEISFNNEDHIVLSFEINSNTSLYTIEVKMELTSLEFLVRDISISVGD